MARKDKLGREKRKKKNQNGAWHAFVTNKWDGKEPYEEFQKREFKYWNNLPANFKNPIRKILVK